MWLNFTEAKKWTMCSLVVALLQEYLGRIDLLLWSWTCPTSGRENRDVSRIADLWFATLGTHSTCLSTGSTGHHSPNSLNHLRVDVTWASGHWKMWFLVLRHQHDLCIIVIGGCWSFENIALLHQEQMKQCQCREHRLSECAKGRRNTDILLSDIQQSQQKKDKCYH